MADKLLVVGVDEKGYGKIYKLVMRDRDLPLTAKALYAYFCSYCGSGTTAFPSRDKIMSDLHFAKNTYTKHLNNLLTKKYLKRHRTAAGNVFEILLIVPAADGSMVEVKSQGYGTVPKFAMLDDRLPIAAKAIYAYMCSYAGAGNTAYPKGNTILHELNIDKETYYSYFNLLTDLGYITVTQQITEKGRFSSSTYLLNEILGIDPRIDPDEIRKSASASQKKNRCRKNPETVENSISTEFSTAMSQKSGNGNIPMSQKSGNGVMSQKSGYGNLRHANINNNLHNKQDLSSIEDRDNEHPRAYAHEEDQGILFSFSPKEKTQQLIHYDRIQDACEKTVAFKKVLNPYMTEDEAAAYMGGYRKVLNELVKQLSQLLFGESEFVKIGGRAVRRTDLADQMQRSIEKNPMVFYEIVTQIADALPTIRSLAPYIRQTVLNRISNF